METIRRNQGWIIVGVATVALILFFALSVNKKDDVKTDTAQQTASNPNTSTQKQTQTSDKTVPTTAPTYSYVAQAGDSYTVLARKAVETYGITQKVTLSQAQIIAAETLLTNAAGSPYLNEGQAVTFDPNSVKSTVEAVQKLTAQDIAAWQLYVPYVDFNTDKNG